MVYIILLCFTGLFVKSRFLLLLPQYVGRRLSLPLLPPAAYSNLTRIGEELVGVFLLMMIGKLAWQVVWPEEETYLYIYHFRALFIIVNLTAS